MYVPLQIQTRILEESQCDPNMLLPSGSVLLMQGATQEEYEHCVPLEEGSAPLRISLTFRSIMPGWEAEQHKATDTCCTHTQDYAK